jgi:3-oxo-5-alpha-steroid 4-dehydrogenase 1
VLSWPRWHRLVATGWHKDSLVVWLTGDPTYDTVAALAFGFVALVAVAAWFVPSAYGRFASPRFGVAVSPRLGWFLMELPSTLVFLAAYAAGVRRGEVVSVVLLAIWLVHYGYRGFYFPWAIRAARGDRATFSVAIIVAGWLSTSLHGYLNAAYITTVGGGYDRLWLMDPRFVFGVVVYYLGFVLTIRADATVRNLRTATEVQSGTKVYRIPRGGLFEYVTNASYLGELVAWLGFAVMTWSPGGLFIFLLSLANLLPRAVATHRWYKKRFSDYPKERRILLPFVL